MSKGFAIEKLRRLKAPRQVPRQLPRHLRRLSQPRGWLRHAESIILASDSSEKDDKATDRAMNGSYLPKTAS